MTAPGCPLPSSCPVPSPSRIDLRRLRTVQLDPGGSFFTASWARYWPGLFNPSSKGDARFSPLLVGAAVIPVVYGARRQTVALLETVFHDVHQALGQRLVTHSDLAGRNLIDFKLQERVVLYDLRDDALTTLGLERDQLVSTTAAHYPCTREWAALLHDRKGVGSARPTGILWNSRVVEVAKADSVLLEDLLVGQSQEVFILFGDHMPTIEPNYFSAQLRYDDLSSTTALPLVGPVAELLGATLV